MKQTITKDDLRLIAGKFIIQLDSDKPVTLTEKNINLDFYLNKRIRFVSFGKEGIITSDLFGNTFNYSDDKFIEMFNEYLGDSKGKRYHRLLYNKELDLVFNFMKNRNY